MGRAAEFSESPIERIIAVRAGETLHIEHVSLVTGAVPAEPAPVKGMWRPL